jgi:hypothetical protein
MRFNHGLIGYGVHFFNIIIFSDMPVEVLVDDDMNMCLCRMNCCDKIDCDAGNCSLLHYECYTNCNYYIGYGCYYSGWLWLLLLWVV